MYLEELKQKFLQHLAECEKSEKTIENYDRYLTRFFLHTKVNKPHHITEEKVRNFRLWLNRQEGAEGFLTYRTQNYYLIALRSFLKYLQEQGISTLSPEQVQLLKLPARSTDSITVEECTRLIAAADTKDEKGLRDRAILELLFSTGMRIHELCALSTDADLSSGELSIRGKQNKTRSAFLSKEAKEALIMYLKARTDMEEPLFVSYSRVDKNRKRLTPRSVQRLVRHYAAKAGLSQKVTPQTIRHIFTIQLLQNGADIEVVQQLLGHANTATTQKYLEKQDSPLQNAHATFHGKQ